MTGPMVSGTVLKLLMSPTKNVGCIWNASNNPDIEGNVVGNRSVVGKSMKYITQFISIKTIRQKLCFFRIFGYKNT
jgi:hypothetical protein